MRSKGEEPIIKTLNDEEYQQELHKKLKEEVAEYLESQEPIELADILEVVFALADLHKISKNDLMRLYQEKHNQRGGFRDKVFLIGKN